MISIIVPIYNAEKTLPKCIESILCQTYKDFELILVDDGSLDSSLSICNVYKEKDRRVKVYSQENRGASAARNLGLTRLRGDWVTFCDSDDYVDKDWLYSFYQCVDDEVDLAIQGYVKVSDLIAKCPICDYDLVCSGKEGCDVITEKKQFGYTPMKLFRVPIILKNNLRFDTRYWLKEDELFVLTYLPFVRNVSFSRHCGYYYVLQDNHLKYSLAGEIEKQYNLLTEQFRIIKENKDFYEGCVIFETILRRLTNVLVTCKTTDMDMILKYKMIVGKDLYQLKDVSCLLKTIIGFPASIMYIYLKTNSYIKYLWGK